MRNDENDISMRTSDNVKKIELMKTENYVVENKKFLMYIFFFK